ncbi:CAP domain-containing protein [Geodermatophilus sp. URMC 64]
MHHSPSGPSLSARLSAAFSRWAFHLPRSLRLRGRIAPVVLVCGVVAGIALSIPVFAPAISSAEDTTVDLDASSASSSGDPRTSREERSGVVQLGVDGAPAAETSPETTAAAPESTTEVPASDVPAASDSSSGAAPETTEETTSSSSPVEAAPETSESAPAPAPAPAAAAAPAPAAAPADPSAEGQVLALVNQERAAAGCGPLVADDGLAALARAFSADMRDRGFFSHDDPDGLSPFDRGDRAGVTVMGENIAYGQADAAAVMSDWMNSPGHRANILNCSFSRIGVGVAHGAGGPWWTQDFA